MGIPGTHLRQVVANASWLGAGRVLRMVVNFVVSAWVARVLGAENLGMLARAQAIIAMLGAVAGLGLDTVAMRELRRTQCSPSVLSAVFVLRFLGGAACAVLGIAVALLAGGGIQGREAWLLAILAISLPLQAFDALDFWLLARMDARGSALARNAASMVGALVRSGACLMKGNVFTFAWAQALEALSCVGMLLRQCRRGFPLLDLLHFDRTTVRRLLASSWPLAISGVCVTLSLQADRLLLQRGGGNLAVGLYSAGARLSELWYLIPMSLGVAALPTLVPTAELRQDRVDLNLRSTYRLATWLALAIAIPATPLADYIAQVVYGRSYPGAGSVLAIHIWTLPFLSHVSIRNAALIASGRERVVALLMGAGALTSVVLNLILIQRWQIRGAALAAVFTWALNALVYPLVCSSTRRHVVLFIQSFSLFRRSPPEHGKSNSSG